LPEARTPGERVMMMMMMLMMMEDDNDDVDKSSTLMADQHPHSCDDVDDEVESCWCS